MAGQAIETITEDGEVVAGPSARPPSLGAELKAKENNFLAALPAHMPVERFMRVILTAIQNNPKLAAADRPSLWNAAMRAAQDGLLPDGREGALVIYNTKDGDRWINKVQWMPMIAGIRKKARNSGEIVSWEAQVVHAKDQFEFELGDEPYIKHKPFLGGDPGPVIAAYSVATLKGGEKSREVMTKAQIDKVRSVSKSKDKGPWVDWYEEMCRKVVARRHSKVLPMSTDLDDVIRRDDDLYDMEGARVQSTAGQPRSLAGRLDLLAGAATAAIEHDKGEASEDEQPATEPTDRTADASPPPETSTKAEAGATSSPRRASAPSNKSRQQLTAAVAMDRGRADAQSGKERSEVPEDVAAAGREIVGAWFDGFDEITDAAVDESAGEDDSLFPGDMQ